MIALKAEVIFAVYLITRHRTVRMMGVLATVLIGLTLANGGRGAPDGAQTVLLVGATMAVVSASRVLAPGPAASAAYRAPARALIAPAGRLVGVLLIAGGVAAAAVVALEPRWSVAISLWAVTLAYSGALGALTMTMAPSIGASGSASLGLLAAWFGILPPSAVATAFSKWPLLQGPAVLAWNSLPLSWRGQRWFHAGTVSDGVLMGAWTLFAIVAATWAISRWGAQIERGRGP